MNTRIFHKGLLGLVIGSLLSSCGGGGGSASQTSSYETTLQLDHYMDGCNGMFEYLCLRARSSDTADWAPIGNAIQGFKFEWGHRYSLRIRVTERAVPPIPDAPSTQVTYELLQLQSDTPQPSKTAFTIKIRQPQYSLELANDGSWRLLGLPLSCSTAICLSLAKAQSTRQEVQLDFDHSNAPQGPLNLLAVRLSGA
ncbi:DUF4377 domain-containing protein [Paucibacter sp. APW11]|uniref:DUF4377 domain-containing protein n=1 Tax=Roseateles aquae TaxID=3077235 RepID=A0ABU3PIC2_9BURK|nr:DUF4377 domain-containing protein [Paucibacter sp. APW11]MDT9002299.1 DUF4377 domain-containing protein [Paucibacter sp. APW11]